jgi:hypothetical protein
LFSALIEGKTEGEEGTGIAGEREGKSTKGRGGDERKRDTGKVDGKGAGV